MADHEPAHPPQSTTAKAQDWLMLDVFASRSVDFEIFTQPGCCSQAACP